MRYDKRVLIELSPEVGEYNPDSGTVEVVQEAEYKKIACHLSPLSMHRSMKIFGDYKQTYVIARCKGRVVESPNTVKIGTKKYKVARIQRFRNRTDFYLELMV